MVFVLLRDGPRQMFLVSGRKQDGFGSRSSSSLFRFSRVFFFFCIIHATFYSRFLLDASLVVKGNYFCPITNSIKVKVCLPSFVGKSFFSFPHLLYSLSLSFLSLFFQFSPLDFSFLLFRLFFLLFLFSFSFSFFFFRLF